MFWRMAGFSTASPVESVLEKDNFSLEELLEEDEIIQECKALNSRLINFLREKQQVEQLIHFIVEEAPADAENRRTFKFPFISCEIFTCDVDIILDTLVEDDELMKKLFSFLEPGHSHNALLAGYFSKVVICLLLRKTVSLMHYLQTHREIIEQLVDLIGITSIMEVLIRLIGADEHIYANYTEAMRWLEDTDVLEMIVDKFSSSDSPEVHANAAETLCTITRYAPSGIAAKISSPSLIGRLFINALEQSRPKSVLVNSLSVCISLLDAKRSSVGTYYSYSRQFAQGPSVTTNPETVEGMLGSLGNLLALLDVSSEENVLLTTYGRLQPPLGKQRLKIVEFISVLLSIGNEAAEKEIIRLRAVQRILDLFFEYPFNNFLHHHVEVIVVSCLDDKKSTLVEYLLRDCNLVGRILEAERSPLLSTDPSKPTACTDGTHSARIGNIGHLTRISNKLIHMASTNSIIQGVLQENTEWLDWCGHVLSKRNAVENVYQWACGRPTPLHDRGRDSDDDDYQDRDYDVAALANNLSLYGIYQNDMDEVQKSLERDAEDIYFNNESDEVVISSLLVGDDKESDLLSTNSNLLALEDDHANNETSTGPNASQITADEPNSVNTINDDDVHDDHNDSDDADTVTSKDDLVDSNSSQEEQVESKASDSAIGSSLPASDITEGGTETEWVEWRETSTSDDPSNQGALPIRVEELTVPANESYPSPSEPSPSTQSVTYCDVKNVDESSCSLSTSADALNLSVEALQIKEPDEFEKTDTTEAEN